MTRNATIAQRTGIREDEVDGYLATLQTLANFGHALSRHYQQKSDLCANAAAVLPINDDRSYAFQRGKAVVYKEVSDFILNARKQLEDINAVINGGF